MGGAAGGVERRAAGTVVGGDDVCHPEIGNLDSVLGGEEQVLGLEVAVDHVVAVEVAEAAEDVAEVRAAGGQRERLEARELSGRHDRTCGGGGARSEAGGETRRWCLLKGRRSHPSRRIP